MKIEVNVKDEKVLQFFDLLNALKDDYVIDFNAHYEEDIEDVEYEDETNPNHNKAS